MLQETTSNCELTTIIQTVQQMENFTFQSVIDGHDSEFFYLQTLYYTSALDVEYYLGN